MDIVPEIKSRLNIVDVIREYAPDLKKRGHTWKACCPFHKEKTPSFTVSEEKQLFYCFGCSCGGDVIKFIELIEKVDFQEALEILANRAGVEVKKNKFTPTVSKNEKEKVLEINELACQFFQKNFSESKVAQGYLKNRKISDEIIEKFRLGFALDDFHALDKYLQAKGFTKKEILAAGLFGLKEVGGEIYDRFRSRLMIPIFDLQGRVVAFGGRILGEGDPKYLNSSESPVYKKSEIFFASPEARQDLRNSTAIIIVEGYFDALAHYSIDLKSVIAPCGTSLTLEQLQIIKRFNQKIIFAFDSDRAGTKAIERGILLALTLDFEIKVMQVPSGKDPDDFIKKDPEKWKELIQAPISAWDFMKKIKLAEFDLDSVQGKKDLIKELVDFFEKIQSPIEFDVCLEDLANSVGLSRQVVENELKRYFHKNLAKNIDKERNVILNKTKINLEDYLLGLVFAYPKFISEIDLDFFPESLLKKTCFFVQKRYDITAQEHGKIVLDDSFSSKEKEKIDLSTLIIDEKYGNFNEINLEENFKKILKRVYQEYKRKYQDLLMNELSNAKRLNQKEKEIEITKKIIELNKKAKTLKIN